jgi:phosphotriesterase-related protein
VNRRDFVFLTMAGAALASGRRLTAAESDEGKIVTVTGPIAPDQLGTTLPHEHVMVDFIGAEEVSRDRYDPEKVLETVLPHLKRVREAGATAFVDCTPAYLARDPALLKRLAQASGLHILTNTGYYGARAGQFLPKHVQTESADQLAARWIAEWTGGIENSGVRPGFIKIGVDKSPLNATSRKLVRAAARTHLKSGLTIACHTGDGAAAMEEMELLREEGVDPSAWIWVHAQNEADRTLFERAAGRGGWVEFDGMGADSIDRHVELVSFMKERGSLNRVLISQDAGWYWVGEPGGGKFRSYTTIFERFLPALAKAGFSKEEINTLMVKNPAEAFTVRVRRLHR